MARKSIRLARVRTITAIAAIAAAGAAGAGVALAGGGATSHQTGTAFICDGQLATIVGTDNPESLNGTPGTRQRRAR